MADIRIICPQCRAELQVDESFEGQEVECGTCMQIFIARRLLPQTPASDTKRLRQRPLSQPAGRSQPSGQPDRQNSDDYDIYEDDWAYSDDDYAPPPPYRTHHADNSMGVAALVLGIISVVFFCCWPVAGLTSLLAIVCGVVGLRSRDGRGMAIAGLILGLIGAGLTVVVFAIGIGFGNLGRF